MNRCNCPNCQTDNCPAGFDEALTLAHLKRQQDLAKMWKKLADNLAVMVYASGCGIGTKTMLEYEKAKHTEET